MRHRAVAICIGSGSSLLLAPGLAYVFHGLVSASERSDIGPTAASVDEAFSVACGAAAGVVVGCLLGLAYARTVSVALSATIGLVAAAIGTLGLAITGTFDFGLVAFFSVMVVLCSSLAVGLAALVLIVREAIRGLGARLA
jgi:hypothetical protein